MHVLRRILVHIRKSFQRLKIGPFLVKILDAWHKRRLCMAKRRQATRRTAALLLCVFRRLALVAVPVLLRLQAVLFRFNVLKHLSIHSVKTLKRKINHGIKILIFAHLGPVVKALERVRMEEGHQVKVIILSVVIDIILERVCVRKISAS